MKNPDYPIISHHKSSFGRTWELRTDWDEDDDCPKQAVLISFAGYYWRKVGAGYLKVAHPRILVGSSQLTIWDEATGQWDHLLGFDNALADDLCPYGNVYYGTPSWKCNPQGAGARC